MSLFDKASLVVTPNGVKEGKLYSIKPTDGSGDLDVVRATTATRVNSEGLIEQVPYNLLNYSEQFDDAAWTKVRISITANETTAPDGNVTSDKITCTETSNNGCFFRQTTTLIAERTTSIYVKPNTCNYFQIHKDFGSGVVFDLTNGTIKQSLGATGTIVNVGNGWFRCTATFNVSGLSLFILGNSSMTVTSWSSTVNESLYLWGAQLEAGSVATSYFPTTDRLNVPRLDYTNGSCPSILVEPQRTNLMPYSEDFSNASWNLKTNVTLLSGQSSPKGDNSAYLLSSTANNGFLQGSITGTPLINYTHSFYVKSNNVTGLIWLKQANGTLQAISLTNEWTRFSTTSQGLTATIRYGITFQNAGDSVYIWGAQIEQGSYPTSYIPTTSSAVTRNADVISKTGISDLIGQTEGTLFAQFSSIELGTNRRILGIKSTNNQNRIALRLTGSNNIGVEVIANNVVIYNVNLNIGFVKNTFYKIAVKYSNNNIKTYLNGVLILDSGVLSLNFASLVEILSIGISELNLVTENINGKIKQAQLYKTALTDTECIALTTL